MSTYPPPTEEGVQFNALDWVEDPNSGITLSEGDSRYLRKNQTDVASSQITFVGGTVMNSLQAYLGNLNIGTNGSANLIALGSANSNVSISGTVGNISSNGFLRATSGLSTYTSQTPFKIQSGSTSVASSNVTITFSPTFSSPPVVYVSAENSTLAPAVVNILNAPTAGNVTFYAKNLSNVDVSVNYHWMAIGI
jgi:hypothetical protein